MVYIICESKSNNNIFRAKIGKANNPQSRLKELQTGNSSKLMLLHTERGGLKREKELHSLFKKFSLNQGEWFILDDEIVEYINSHENNNIYYVFCQDDYVYKTMRIKK